MWKREQFHLHRQQPLPVSPFFKNYCSKKGGIPWASWNKSFVGGKQGFVSFLTTFLTPSRSISCLPKMKNVVALSKSTNKACSAFFFFPYSISSSLSWNGLSLYMVETQTMHEDKLRGAGTALTLRLSCSSQKGTNPAEDLREIQREVQNSLLSYAKKYCASVQRSLSYWDRQEINYFRRGGGTTKSESPKGSGSPGSSKHTQLWCLLPVLSFLSAVL